MSDYPPLPVVNENDEVVGEAMLDDVIDQGLIYRIVFVSVHDTQGRILLQRRNPNLRFFPNMWDVGCAGHVDAGEDYETAALRELQEELGISEVKLELVDKFRNDIDDQGKRLHRFSSLFKVVVDPNTDFKIEPEEVSEVKWFTMTELQDLFENHSSEVVADLVKMVNKYFTDENN